MYKTHHARSTFGSWDVEKVHAVVARSTFQSQNVQTTPFSDHFWKLRCRKSAPRCGMLWRKAHVQVKSKKTGGYGTLLDVQMSFCVAGAGDCVPCQEWGNVRVSEQFQIQSPLHYTTLHHTTLLTTATTATALRYTTLHYTNYTTLHSTSLHYTTRHSIALHYNHN